MPGIGPVTCGRDVALGSDGRARLGRCCDPTLGRWKLGVCGRAMPPMPPGIPAGRCAVGMFGRAVGIFGRAVGMFGRAVGMFGRAVGICGRGVGICGLACGAGRDIAGLPPPAPPTPPARPIDGRPWASAATRTMAMAHQTQPSRRPTARRRMDSYFLESVEKGTDAPGTSRESGTSQAFPSHFAAAAAGAVVGAVAGAGGLRAITSLKSGS